MWMALVGFSAFVAVKFAGYCLAAWFLNRTYGSTCRSPWAVGAARTGIGLVAGMAYGLAWTHLAPSQINPLLFFFLALLPIRLLEWGLLLRWFYEPNFLRGGRAWKAVALGTLWSYALDAVGVVAALVVPGGRGWVC
jgi:hypothetical protein